MKPIHLLAAALAFLSLLTAQAAMLAGSKPREWPADPHRHVATIQREAADDGDNKLIAAAEKSLPDVAALAKSIGRDGAAPKLQPGQWWNKEVLGIRIPFALTADAVRYYTDLMKDHGQRKLTRYAQPSSGFNYRAGVARHDTYELDGKPLHNVTVVTMSMTFRQNFVASMTEGFSFEKSRSVIFDKDGKLLGVRGDGDVEVPVFAM